MFLWWLLTALSFLSLFLIFPRDDRTQDSVLKMLAIGGEGDVIDRLMEMNIAPLAISYEYDPCDFLKAQEFQLKRDIEGYKKTTADDEFIPALPFALRHLGVAVTRQIDQISPFSI